MGNCYEETPSGGGMKRRKVMNFYDKKVRKITSIVILVVIVAMLATMVIPYLVV